MTNPIDTELFTPSASSDIALPGGTDGVLRDQSCTHAAPRKKAPVFLKDLIVRNAQPENGQDRSDIYDAHTKGLVLRVTSNKKSWGLFFTVPGTTTQRARLALGTYPATSLDAARQRAKEAMGLVEAGTDPRTIMPVEAPKTVAGLWQDRLELVLNGPKPLRSAWLIEWRFKKYILPLVREVPVRDFRVDPHYNLVIDPIVKRGKLRMAGQVHTDLVTLMNYGIERGVIEFSRLAKTKSKDPKNVRKRNLTPAEIVLFWNELPKALVRSKSCQRILTLCLISGQRLSEVAGMTREGEIDWNALIWTIPAERVKNGEKYGDHIVPLPPMAVTVIREALAVNSNQTEWLFPNDAGDGPLDAEVIARTLGRAFEAGDFSFPKITPHDLRRTVGTQMVNKANGLGITKHQKYLVLNHMSQVIQGVSDEVYDQNDYTPDKREALEAYAAWLSKLVNTGEAVS